MNNPFTFEAEQFEYATPDVLPRRGPSWETPYPQGYEYEDEGPVAPPPPLAGPVLARALATNRAFARQFGWGCVFGGQIHPIPEILTLLGLAAGATETAIAQAIAQWQWKEFGRPGDGQLGPGSWTRILQKAPPVIPPFAFKRAAWEVFFGGQNIGVLEKTAPYEQCYLEAGDNAWAGDCRPLPTRRTTRAGARIQLGFRIANMDAIQRAGFVHPASGEPHFNFVQMIETNRPLVAGPPVHSIRRYRRLIDPTVIPRDNNPYFWDEPGPPGDIAQNIHRVAADPHFPRGSHLCYDVLFWDYATRSLADADPPGLGLYWNAEVVLVGIRAGNRNVALNSVKWGFDIRPGPGALPTVRLNALEPGPLGGSPGFRQVLADEIRGGNFPGHCFVGAGFGRGAVCA